MDYGQSKIKITLQHGSKIYEPAVVGEVTVEWTRFATAGKMNLTIIKDDVLEFEEGDILRLYIDDKPFFFGVLFTYERVENNQYKLTAYDVLRYFKSQDVFKMSKQTYGAALKKVCKRYGLKTGTIYKTGYVRKAKVFTGTVFSMLENYRKATKDSNGKQYILFADFDKVCLKNQTAMKTNYVISVDVGQNYTYSSSIDDKVYTVIKLYRKTGKKTKVYTKVLTSAKKKYGRLTYAATTKLKKKAKINKKLKSIAESYDSPRKKLSFTGVFGIPELRAGSGVIVKLEDVGMSLNKNMTINTITHRFNEGIHTMDFQVIGGDYKS